MISAAGDFVANNAKNPATNRATCLARNICGGSRLSCCIAGDPTPPGFAVAGSPATTARLRITLWRGGGRRCWRGALIQIRGRRRRRAKIKLHRRRFLCARLRSEKWPRRKAQHARNQIRLETAHCHVVVLHSGVEVPALRSEERRVGKELTDSVGAARE